MANLSTLTQIPENTSFLQSAKFIFTIPSLPFARYFCQSVNFPGVSANEVLVSTPFADTYRHGDNLVFEPLTIDFLIDEDLRVWEETYIWLATLTNPIKFKEYGSKFKDKYYDGILTINTNANIPNLRVHFRYCHPVNIGAIQFDSRVSAETTPTCTLTLRYDTFKIERL